MASTAKKRRQQPVKGVKSMRWLVHLLGQTEEDLWKLADNAGGLYESFDIWKGRRPDGSDRGWRHIDRPTLELERVQQRIYNRLLEPLAPSLPSYLTGGMPGRSVLENASPHIGRPVVIGLDIHNCFPSIPHKRIFEVWRNDLDYSDAIATLLTKLTTHHEHLPQGATTSSMLCNLALAPMAARIEVALTPQDLIFTLYVDDITFSGDPVAARAAIVQIVQIVNECGYKISRDKVPIMDSNEIQRTTGIKVNNALTVERRKQQAIIREIQEVGALGHQATIHQVNRIWGLVGFVKYVHPVQGERLERIAKAEIGDIVGKYVPKPRDKRRQCKSMRASHK